MLQLPESSGWMQAAATTLWTLAEVTALKALVGSSGNSEGSSTEQDDDVLMGRHSAVPAPDPPTTSDSGRRRPAGPCERVSLARCSYWAVEVDVVLDILPALVDILVLSRAHPHRLLSWVTSIRTAGCRCCHLR